MIGKKAPTERQMESWTFRTKYFEFGNTLIPLTPISKLKISEIWKHITDKPIPKIEAYLLSNQNFEYCYRKRNVKFSKCADIIEHGRPVDVSETGALVYKTEDGYRILIRWKYYSLDLLKHELSHIASGGLEKIEKIIKRRSKG